MEDSLTLRDLTVEVTREIDFHNSSTFTSETSESFPAADTKNMTYKSVITLESKKGWVLHVKGLLPGDDGLQQRKLGT